MAEAVTAAGVVVMPLPAVEATLAAARMVAARTAGRLAAITEVKARTATKAVVLMVGARMVVRADQAVSDVKAAPQPDIPGIPTATRLPATHLRVSILLGPVVRVTAQNRPVGRAILP
jgi:hypothetical protein